MEVHYLFREALEQLDQLEVPMTTLTTLMTLISVYQNRFDLFQYRVERCYLLSCYF